MNEELMNQYNNDPSYQERCIEKATNWAWANRSDPFAFRVCLKDLQRGLCHVADDSYTFDKRTEKRSVFAPSLHKRVTINVEIPTNMKIV